MNIFMLDQEMDDYEKLCIVRRETKEAIELLTLALHANERQKTHVVDDHVSRAVDYLKALQNKIG